MKISLIVKSANKNVYLYRTNFESRTNYLCQGSGRFLRDQVCISNKYSCSAYFYV